MALTLSFCGSNFDSCEKEIPIHDRLRFTGHERDLGNPTTVGDDMDYMHARYYKAQMGRFLSVDTMMGKTSRPQTFNLFSYVFGNPLSLVDPTGNVPYDPGDVIFRVDPMSGALDVSTVMSDSTPDDDTDDESTQIADYGNQLPAAIVTLNSEQDTHRGYIKIGVVDASPLGPSTTEEVMELFGTWKTEKGDPPHYQSGSRKPKQCFDLAAHLTKKDSWIFLWGGPTSTGMWWKNRMRPLTQPGVTKPKPKPLPPPNSTDKDESKDKSKEKKKDKPENKKND